MDLNGMIITGPAGEKYRLIRIDESRLAPIDPAAFADSVEKRVKALKISWRALAREARVTNQTLIEIRKKRRDFIHPGTVVAVLGALERLSSPI